MVREHNILKAIYLSFFSRELYRDVAFNWGGSAILYLLLIVALSWIGATWQTQKALTVGYQFAANWVVPQIPQLTIDDGKLATPGNKPYKIKTPQQKVVAIIDTSGKYTNLNQANVNLLITKDKVIISTKKNETRTYDVPKHINQVIYPQKVNTYIANMLGYLWIPIFIVAVLFSFVYRIVQAFIYALIGKLFNYFYGTTLTYGQIVLISMVAVTPALFLATALGLLGIRFNGQFLLYFIVSILYIFYGVASCRQNK